MGQSRNEVQIYNKVLFRQTFLKLFVVHF